MSGIKLTKKQKDELDMLTIAIEREESLTENYHDKVHSYIMKYADEFKVANGGNSENANCAIFDVSGSLPDKFADIIRFIESDLMEVKLYGNDGFDNQEELDGKDYLVKLIKEAVGNDR